MAPWEAAGVNFVSAVGFPGYVFGDDGSAWSCRKLGGRGLTEQWRPVATGERGYRLVGLRRPDGALVTVGLHRLILTLFVGPPPTGAVACHLNHNKADNRLCNLVWGTAQENVDQSTTARRHAAASSWLQTEDRMAEGTTPTQIRLTDEDKAKVEAIRERFGLPSMAAAIRYAVETTHRQIAREKNPKKPK